MNHDGQTISHAVEDDLSVSIGQLAKLRCIEADAKEQLDLLRKRLEETQEWQEWQQTLDNARANLNQVDTHIRELTVVNFIGYGEKHPHPAVGIRENIKVEYDRGRALEWSKTNLTGALALDAKVFEKYIKMIDEMARPDFVSVKTEPSATIATDLSAYLAPD